MKTVSLTIDGKEITVPAGTLIIRAAEQLGIEIPRFCDHPLLEPAGACRQCYVQIEGQPKLATSCTATVAPGMVVSTQNTSEVAHQAQVANLEFLLLNHPLDCPICDRGGECPLQDQALAFGPGESRFTEAKRTFAKPVPLSDLVQLDRERCILCARCTRFCDQISGDRFIELFARGAGERVSIAAGEDFRSPFSGNTIQICPVGALTSSSYRFVARPFDLSTVDTICPHCSAGCNIKLDVRRGEVVRQLARDNLEVNDAWLCDKGRFAYRFPDDPARITTPLIRDRGLEPASFGEVLSRVASWCDGKRVAFLTGGRLMDEDYYALSKLARTVFHTNDLDHRRDGGPLPLQAEIAAAAVPMSVTYRDVEEAPAILVAGLDAEQEIPILHLRLRKAARNGAKIWVLHPRRTRLHDVATHVLCAPGEEQAMLVYAARGEGDPSLIQAIEALREAAGTGVWIAGERLGGPGADAVSAFARDAGGRFTYVSRRANDRGALRAGVHPGLLPGGRTMMSAAAGDVEEAWGPLSNPEPGRGARNILEACAEREIDVLFLIGVDPLRDFPDASLARRALETVPIKVVQSLELGSLEPYADAFLPAAAFCEKDGHFTTWEGRGQRLRPIRGPKGISLADWEIFTRLALAAGGDLGWDSLDGLHEEMGPLLAPRDGALAERVTADSDASADRIHTGASSSSGGELRLFTYPLLVDEGRLSERSDELKATLEDEAFAEIHPDDAVAAGLADGDRAILRTDAGEAELPVRVTPHIAKGSVFVPFNQPGLQTNTLLSGSFQTAVTLAPVSGTAADADATAAVGSDA
jgi:NADH-quinone oxidoreductase subunit G